MNEKINHLRINIMDCPDPEQFLQALEVFLTAQGVTANGILRTNVDPETGSAGRHIQILNNQPVLRADQEIRHD